MDSQLRLILTGRESSVPFERRLALIEAAMVEGDCGMHEALENNGWWGSPVDLLLRQPPLFPPLEFFDMLCGDLGGEDGIDGMMRNPGSIRFMRQHWAGTTDGSRNHCAIKNWFGAMMELSPLVGHVGLEELLRLCPDAPGIIDMAQLDLPVRRYHRGGERSGQEILLICQAFAFLRDSGFAMPEDALALARLDQEAIRAWNRSRGGKGPSWGVAI